MSCEVLAETSIYSSCLHIFRNSFQVETVEGDRDLHIPSGTQPGETLTFHKMGVPQINKPSVRGDHHFIVRVQIPRTIRFDLTCFKLYVRYIIMD